MPLSDKDILQAMEQGKFFITPFIRDNLQPASIDLTLGDTIKFIGGGEPIDVTADNEHRYRAIDISKASFRLEPGAFALGHVSEYVKMGPFSGQVHGRSSIARLGVQVNIASYVNPGYEGTLPVAMVNHSGVPIDIIAGIRVCQLVVFEVGEIEREYSMRKDAKYLGETEPTGSRFHLDAEIQAFLNSRGIKSVSDRKLHELRSFLAHRIEKLARANAKRLGK